MNITTSFGQQIEVTETPNGLSVSRRRVDRFRDGNIVAEWWLRDGKLHRDDGHASIEYREGKVFPGETRTFEELVKDGVVKRTSWHRNGKPHRDNGPAITWYYDDGSVQANIWYLDGEYHRDDGPARIVYLEGKVLPGDTRTFEELEKDGVVRRANWYRDGKRVKRFT